MDSMQGKADPQVGASSTYGPWISRSLHQSREHVWSFPDCCNVQTSVPLVQVYSSAVQHPRGYSARSLRQCRGFHQSTSSRKPLVRPSWRMLPGAYRMRGNRWALWNVVQYSKVLRSCFELFFFPRLVNLFGPALANCDYIVISSFSILSKPMRK